MLAPSSVIKATAKTAMRGKYFKCIITATIFVFASLLVLYSAGLISVVSSNSAASIIAFALLAFFLLVPLFLGVLRFFRRMLWGEDDNPVLVFHYFSSVPLYLRAIRFGFYFGIRIALSALLLFLPSVIVGIFTETAFYDALDIAMPIWISNFWIISVFLRVAGATGLFFIALRWYMAPFLYVADEEMDALEAVHMSSVISRRTSLDFFLLIISFALWIAVSLFMVPIVFTLPYFICAYIVHCRFAVAQYNRVIDAMNSQDAPSFAAEV